MQISWIFPPLGFQSWVGSKYPFYGDYFNIFFLEAFKINCGMKWSSPIHLENTFRAGVRGNFRQPEYGKAINTWVGRTPLLKLLAISVGIRGQHLEAWQVDCKERTYEWVRESLQPRVAAGRWPEWHQNRGLESTYFSESRTWGKDCCFRPTKSIGKGHVKQWARGQGRLAHLEVDRLLDISQQLAGLFIDFVPWPLDDYLSSLCSVMN